MWKGKREVARGKSYQTDRERIRQRETENNIERDRERIKQRGRQTENNIETDRESIRQRETERGRARGVVPQKEEASISISILILKYVRYISENEMSPIYLI